MKSTSPAGIPSGEIEHCAVCGKDGETALRLFANGMIGRTCPHCRACRAFKPYAKRSEYEAAKIHDTAKAGKVERNAEKTK